MNLHRSVFAVVALLASTHFSPAQEITPEMKELFERRIRSIRQQFTNFPSVRLLPPTNQTEAAIQTLKINEHNLRTADGFFFTGVRFKLPEWLDGDLQWVFFHLNPPERKREHVPIEWGIVLKREGLLYPRDPRRLDPVDSLPFWQRFPNTRRVYSLTMSKTNFHAGEECALYFAHFTPDPPDIAFAITVNSERGRKELGSFDFISGRDALPGERSASPRTIFLEEHFEDFLPVKFLAPTNRNETTIQTFSPFEQEVGVLDDEFYSGVRFTLPDWLDGDLHWSFFHLNPEAQKRRPVAAKWDFLAPSGQRLTIHPQRIDADDTVEFWKRYPNTRRVYSHVVPRAALRPGQSYGIFFSHTNSDPPAIAFGLTVDSERGRKEFGSLKFISGRPGLASVDAPSPRAAFIQENFVGFPLVKFLPPTNGTEATFRRFAVKSQMVGEFEGEHFAGVRFQVPEWMDGDLEVSFFNLYRPQDLPRRFGISWSIEAEQGKMPAVRDTARLTFTDLPKMAKSYPTTDKAYVNTIARRYLQPGGTYVFTWSYTLADVPDLMFALTINSERGRKEFGELMW